MKLPKIITNKLFNILKKNIADKRPPDKVIGDNYLRRWWVIPRNPFFNIYLHNIQHSDDDRALHDHMYVNCSILLSGGYYEVLKGNIKKWRDVGFAVFRLPSTAHRLEVDGIQNVWTLFITGPRVRHWYFHCPQGLVKWEAFTDPDDSGNIGKGCDQ